MNKPELNFQPPDTDDLRSRLEEFITHVMHAFTEHALAIILYFVCLSFLLPHCSTRYVRLTAWQACRGAEDAEEAAGGRLEGGAAFFYIIFLSLLARALCMRLFTGVAAVLIHVTCWCRSSSWRRSWTNCGRPRRQSWTPRAPAWPPATPSSPQVLFFVLPPVPTIMHL